ncbi:TonB-dependent receptor [Aquabacterium sp. OR-4]|uniref:TonB-dependent receptor n=1 Tax=Aquabacterium sp. OR-4 TaxID=2978127 RepID=UPI0028C5A169|nr:TonB-dependent receptor [Aquabacterium sp. OR-4]MDT7838408.1 TonB-dependent receptor [Aquabacterium sp. OR-4]
MQRRHAIETACQLAWGPRPAGRLAAWGLATACAAALAQQAPSSAPGTALDRAATPPGAPASGPAVPRVVVQGRRPIDAGPMPGLDLSRDQVPANLQSAGKKEIKASRALNLGDYMNTQLQGVSINDYAGNPFQIDVNYRGFTASPQIGTPQGLSVFFDGIRVNEPFGDVVNWDLIPLNAIDRFDLFPGSNPLFGLNTLGGGISVRSKNGFSSAGFDGQVLLGAWGRRQLQLSGGGHDGTLAGFFALTRFEEKGWRDQSPSRVNQLFGRADWRGERASAYASLLYGDNRLVGNGLIPIELYRQRPEAVFTSPDEARNRLVQVSLGGQYDLAERVNLTGQVYHRASRRRGLNGDIYAGFDDFGDRDISADGTARNGATRGGGFTGPGVVAGTPIGQITRTDLDQRSDGGALQLNWNLPRHAFMLGLSIDRNRTGYDMAQRLGLIDASHQVDLDVAGIDPDYYAAEFDVPGNNFSGSSTTRSLYLQETWTPTAAFTLTASARYNHTRVSSELLTRSTAGQVALHELREFRASDFTDGQVFRRSRSHESFGYRSFNPSLGLNWRPGADINVFGNLSRGARTPSVVELGCAFDPTPVERVPGSPALGTAPRSLTGPGCNLPTSLSSDPYLPQIRASSGEIGVRQRLSAGWDWNIGLFRTDLRNDIYFVGVGDGRSYFDTIGKTRRQGLELGLNGRLGPLDMTLSYSFTDATFQSRFYTLSPHNSTADFNQNSGYVGDAQVIGQDVLPTPNAALNRGYGTYRMIRIDPGARMPGIPAHALNLRLTHRLTPSWKLGLGMVARSLAYMRGNENNLHQPAGSDQEVGRYYCSQAGGCDFSGFSQLPVRTGRPFASSGRVPGYAVFNLDTSVELGGGLSAFAQVSNLFNRQYFSAGRLGVNPFAPSVNGAIGPSGWNYNSSEWQNTSLVAPGAPRALFVGLSWELGAGP